MNDNSGASGANISEQERTASLLAGSGLALAGLQLCVKGRLPAALGLLALGGALLYRGKTQHCPVYEAAGVNRAEVDAQEGQSETPAAKPQNEKVAIVQVMTINKPAQELYDFWRRGDRFGRILAAAGKRALSGRKSLGMGRKGAQRRVAALGNRNQRRQTRRTYSLAFTEAKAEGQSLPAPHDGAISFRELAHDRGTEVRLEINYNPPGSILGAAMAKLFGAVPDQFALEMLRRFKQLMETGEMANARNQPDQEEKS